MDGGSSQRPRKSKPPYPQSDFDGPDSEVNGVYDYDGKRRDEPSTRNSSAPPKSDAESKKAPQSSAPRRKSILIDPDERPNARDARRRARSNSEVRIQEPGSDHESEDSNDGWWVRHRDGRMEFVPDTNSQKGGKKRNPDLERKTSPRHREFRDKRDGYESEEGETLKGSKDGGRPKYNSDEPRSRDPRDEARSRDPRDEARSRDPRDEPRSKDPRPEPRSRDPRDEPRSRDPRDRDEPRSRDSREDRGKDHRVRDGMAGAAAGAGLGAAAAAAAPRPGMNNRRDPKRRDPDEYDDRRRPPPRRNYDDDDRSHKPRPSSRREYDDDYDDRRGPRRGAYDSDRDRDRDRRPARRPAPRRRHDSPSSSSGSDTRRPVRSRSLDRGRDDRDRRRDKRDRDRDPRDKQGDWKKEAGALFLSTAMPIIKKEGGKMLRKQLEGFGK